MAGAHERRATFPEPSSWAARALELLRRGGEAIVVCGMLAAAGGCASSGAAAGASAPNGASESSAPRAHIASVFHNKCGSCHAPVQPGSISHEKLEAAMQRHKRRAKLTDAEWSELVDFLAADEPREVSR